MCSWVIGAQAALSVWLLEGAALYCKKPCLLYYWENSQIQIQISSWQMLRLNMITSARQIWASRFSFREMDNTPTSARMRIKHQQFILRYDYNKYGECLNIICWENKMNVLFKQTQSRAIWPIRTGLFKQIGQSGAIRWIKVKAGYLAN